MDRVFDVLSAQPLVDSRTLGDLEGRAREVLQSGTAVVPESEEECRRLVLRFALPSLMVAGDQLEVLVDGDRERYGEIAEHSRRATMRVVLTAIKSQGGRVGPTGVGCVTRASPVGDAALGERPSSYRRWAGRECWGQEICECPLDRDPASRRVGPGGVFGTATPTEVLSEPGGA